MDEFGDYTNQNTGDYIIHEANPDQLTSIKGQHTVSSTVHMI